jgi:capsular exopolysaccharide synthesis family protein
MRHRTNALKRASRDTAAVPPAPVVPRAFADDPHLVLLSRPSSPVAERYRRVRVNLEQGTQDFPFKPQITVITSAVPGEGKTTTAANLALAFAEDATHPSLLVDADLRRPSLSRRITPEPGIGLAEVLAGRVRLDDALISMADSKLCVLPAGASSEYPLELLQGAVFAGLIAELRRRFARIVIDTPPTVPFTDAAVIASHADATLLVVRAGTTTAPLIRRARESLSGANFLGALLNDVVHNAVDRYYYGYEGYATA